MDMISVLLKQTHLQSEQIARLSANANAIEQRIRLAAKTDRQESLARWKELQREVRALGKRIDTQPIAFRQIMDTWWLRLVAIAVLGLANVDLKAAIALVLQAK
jgi:hypothetical protein